MDRANVDTDQIIPKQFLKRIERTGFGQFLFQDWRRTEDGSENPAVRVEPAALSRRDDPAGAAQFRLRLEPRACSLGAGGLRLSRRSSPPASPTSSTTTASRTACCRCGSTRRHVDELFRRCAAREGYQLTVDLEKCTVEDDAGLQDCRSRSSRRGGIRCSMGWTTSA